MEIGGQCCVKKAWIELYMRLSKSVYKLGDEINLHVECRVEGGTTEVKKASQILLKFYPLRFLVGYKKVSH